MYCSIDELKARVPTLDGNERITEATIETIIGEQTAHINAMIQSKYQTPVGNDQSPESFKILRDICIELCRIPISRTLKIAVKGNDSDKNQNPVRSSNENKWEKRLVDIRGGFYPLPDAIPCDDCSSSDSGYYDPIASIGVYGEFRKARTGRY